jgi:hypothetical protein
MGARSDTGHKPAKAARHVTKLQGPRGFCFPSFWESQGGIHMGYARSKRPPFSRFRPALHVQRRACCSVGPAALATLGSQG